MGGKRPGFGMVTFSLSMVLLVAGYLVYGRFVEKVFGIDEKRVTPAYAMRDGIDYIPLPGWKMLASTRPMTTATAVVTR